MYEGYQKKSSQETSKESQSGAVGEVQFGVWQKESSEKPLSELNVDGHLTEDREE